MKQLLLFCFILLALASCKKYGKGYVKGTVYETGTNVRIAGAKVFLGKWNDDGPFKKQAYAIIDSAVTSSEGEYKFLLDKKLSASYNIGCSAAQYYSDNTYELDEKESTQDFYLDPYAFIKVRILKTSTSALKYMDITAGNTKIPRVQSKDALDTVLTIYPMRGNTSHLLYWYVCRIYASPMADQCYYREEANVYVAKGDTITRVFRID